MSHALPEEMPHREPRTRLQVKPKGFSWAENGTFAAAPVASLPLRSVTCPVRPTLSLSRTNSRPPSASPSLLPFFFLWVFYHPLFSLLVIGLGWARPEGARRLTQPSAPNHQLTGPWRSLPPFASLRPSLPLLARPATITFPLIGGLSLAPPCESRRAAELLAHLPSRPGGEQ
jgi:hypothetical protein